MSENTNLVPKRRFKEFQNAATWEQRKLVEISKLGSSKRVHREDYVETGIPFFRGLEISKLGSSSKIEDVLYISEEYYKDLKDKYGVPQTGDILITAVGTLGNSYLIHDDAPFYFKDGNLIWLSDIKINSQYLNIYLGDGIGKKRVLESAAGSSQKALTMVKLQNVQVLFSSNEEQCKIGVFFQNIDNLITLHQRKLEKIKSLKSAYLSELFPAEGEREPKRRFAGFTGAWEQKKLKDVSTYSNGGSFENDVQEKGRYELITLKSVDMSGNLVHSGRYVDIEVPTLIKGTLVMILSEQSPGLLGMTAQIPKDNAYVLNQRVAEIRPNQIVDGYFLSMAINRNQQYFSKCGAGTKVQNISKSNVENYEFLCPLLEEQQKIGAFFKHLDNLITLQQRKLEKLQNIKKAFLNEMFI